MTDLTKIALDARQTPQWADYMRSIGWITEKVNNTYIYIRPIKLFNRSLIKIQHSKEQPDFDQIEQIAKKYKALFIVLEPYSIDYSEEILKKHGFRRSKLKSAFTSTALIDLSPSLDDILKSFSENARRNIKKAQANKITVKHIYTKDETNEENFEKFYHLYTHLGKLKGFYVLPHEECLKRYTAFKENSILSFAYEPNNPDPIAVVWFLYYEKTLVYNHTGITQKGYDLQANALLVWEGINEGKKLGLEVFDFESIYDPRYPSENKKWLGYSNFKSKFHGHTVNYPPPWIKIYNLPFNILNICITTLFP